MYMPPSPQLHMYITSSLSFSPCTCPPSLQLHMYMPSSLSFSLCTCPPSHYNFICTCPPLFHFLSVHAPLATASYVHNILFLLFSLYMPPPSPQLHMNITSSLSFSLSTCPPSSQLHMYIASSFSFSLYTVHAPCLTTASYM